MSTFTKAQWLFEDSDWTIRSKSWGEGDQMGDYKGVIVCDLSIGHGEREHAKPETTANAHLIAAAPDMYEELNVLCDWLNDEMDNWPAGKNEELLLRVKENYDRILAALKKARGE